MIEHALSLTEQQRNRALRRLDWRFLLSKSQPQAIHMPAQRSASLRAALGSFSAVNSNAELAILANPSQHDLQASHAALLPGGDLYCEWSLAPPGGLQRIRHMLQRAGYVNLSCYWAWPPPALRPASFWLPLDAPQAVHGFLEGRPRSRSWRMALRRAMQRQLWQIAQPRGLVAPLAVTARRPGGSADALGETLARHGYVPEQMHSLLLTGGGRSINKVVRFLYANQQRRPFAAVKYARVPESIMALERESTTLAALQKLKAGGILGVPRRIDWQPASGQLIQTALSGQPVYAILRADNLPTVALKASDWLVGLVSGIRSDDWLERIAWPALTTFEQQFGPVIERERVNRLRSALAALGPLPVTCEQRDFAPWNVLVDTQGQLVVLDWESAEVQGLPLLDLWYFLSYLAFTSDGAMESKRFVASYQKLRNPTTLTGAAAQASIQRYASQIGLPAEAIQPLQALCWVIHARSEYRHMFADLGGPPSPEKLAKSVFVDLFDIAMANREHD